MSASFGVAVPLAGGYGLGVLFGLPPLEALFVGVILTATSVSITAQTLMEMGSLQTVEGATVLGAAVIDDVIGLVVFSLVVALTGSDGTGTSGAPSLVLLGVYLLVFFVASATVMPWLIEHACAMPNACGVPRPCSPSPWPSACCTESPRRGRAWQRSPVRTWPGY